MITHRLNHLLPRRVLIIKPSALGDVVTAMPVLRGLKRSFPDVSVDWLVATSCAPLIAHDSDLDDIIEFDRKGLGKWWRSLPAAGKLFALLGELRHRRYDWVIDLQGLLRSGLMTRATRSPMRIGFSRAREGAWVFYNRKFSPLETHTVCQNIELANAMGIDARPEDMTLQVLPEAKDYALRFLQDNGLASREPVAIVPPARWQSKRYPSRRWKQVIAQIAPTRPVILLGAPGDELLCQDIASDAGPNVFNLAGRTTVPQFVAFIEQAGGVLCCDSAAKFIAPAVGTDVVCLIGPTQVDRTGPYPSGEAIVSPAPCTGCLKRSCPQPVCMDLIDPDQVVDAAFRMLGESH
jgi:heptosyltransferase-1